MVLKVHARDVFIKAKILASKGFSLLLSVYQSDHLQPKFGI